MRFQILKQIDNFVLFGLSESRMDISAYWVKGNGLKV
jgi:hypothetical protein